MSHDEAKSSKPSECKSEVIVGCQCGTAVLRGAHVFAPGVLAAPAGLLSNAREGRGRLYE